MIPFYLFSEICQHAPNPHKIKVFCHFFNLFSLLFIRFYKKYPWIVNTFFREGSFSHSFAQKLFLFSQNFVIIYFSMPGSFAGFTGFRSIRQRLKQAWALAHYTWKKPAAIGGWQLVKKGGYARFERPGYRKDCGTNRYYADGTGHSWICRDPDLSLQIFQFSRQAQAKMSAGDL